ncbi:FG-GAP repeat protein [Desulfococcaceae bacterium HSG7]|nr:FG-GAP repeat protein [Desulfococcaceae bacterium HSG7]
MTLHFSTMRQAGEIGGGFYNRNGSPTLNHIIFMGNSVGGGEMDFYYGGGMATFHGNPILNNVIFSNNTSTKFSGGLHHYGGDPVLNNVVFSGNSALDGGGMYNANGNPSLTNCILWSNSGGQIDGSAATVSYSLVQGGYAGEGNRDEDPRFVDSVNGDYQLQPDSPCIDTGIPDTTGLNLPPTDLAGNPRICNIIDMGALEFQGGMLSPAPGTMLDATSVTFTWNDSGADLYKVDLGTSPGADDLYSGAPGTDTSALVNGLPSDESTVYVRLLSLVDGGWLYNDYTYTADNNINCPGDDKIIPSDGAAGDVFGISVAISGNYAIVGAPSQASGAAYIFILSGNEWIQQAKLTASDAAEKDISGIAVDISGDTAIVGAMGDSDRNGSAYVFVKPAGGWRDMTQTAKLTASDGGAYA